MVSASTASGTVTFTYYGLNQRARKALSGSNTYFVYVGGAPLTIVDPSGLQWQGAAAGH